MLGALKRLAWTAVKALVAVVAVTGVAADAAAAAADPIGVPPSLPRIRTKPDVDAAAAAAAAAVAPVFSPYVESWTSQDLRKIPGRSVTLAFLLSDRQGRAAWDGTMQLDTWLARVRASGKRVALSFGGASGTELALAVTDVKALAAQYVASARRYGAWKIDLDVEGWALGDEASVRRRNSALVAVQATLPALRLQYTLPVMPFGLDAGALALLRDAKARGVRLHAVNVMAMNYGDSFTGDMGDYAIQAARATRRQLDALGLKNVGVGITPMVLENDVRANVFTLQDARQVADFAAATPWVRFVGYWATGRDPRHAFATVFSKLDP